MGFTKERNKFFAVTFPKDANFYLSSPKVERAMPISILKHLKSSILKINF